MSFQEVGRRVRGGPSVNEMDQGCSLLGKAGGLQGTPPEAPRHRQARAGLLPPHVATAMSLHSSESRTLKKPPALFFFKFVGNSLHNKTCPELM